MFSLVFYYSSNKSNDLKKERKKTGIELYISLIICSMNQIIFVLLKNYSLFISYAASFIKCEIILKIFQTVIQ